MEAIAYVRVSTVEQSTDGVSLASQRARIEQWCLGNDYTLTATYEDAGLSGKSSDNRPGLQAALTHAQRSGATLVVYSLSRLSRSIADTCSIMERLNKAGGLASLSERIDGSTATGRMVLNLLISLSQFEREQIGERTSCALNHLRNQGRRVSRHIPFAWNCSNGRDLTRNQEEEAAINQVMAWSKAGRTLGEIADELNGADVPTKSGKKWLRGTVHHILKRTMKGAT
jgi:DNA invertase Pin-like site-specific DNA recombinase